jgi:hypothetical protein
MSRYFEEVRDICNSPHVIRAEDGGLLPDGQTGAHVVARELTDYGVGGRTRVVNARTCIQRGADRAVPLTPLMSREDAKKVFDELKTRGRAGYVKDGAFRPAPHSPRDKAPTGVRNG